MSKWLLLLAAALAWFAAPANSQPLQVIVSTPGSTTGVGLNSSVSLIAPGTGQAVFANVSVRYTGTTSATISNISLTGTTEMTLAQTPALPITLSPNASANFTVQYISQAGAATNGQVTIAYTENGAAGTFPFILNGTSPRFTFSYLISPGGTATTLNNGDRILFPATSVGASTNAVVSILNSGSASASLQSLSISGTGFQITNSPAPFLLNPSQQTSFNVVFNPQTSGAAQGSVVLGLTNSTVSFNLLGTGAAPTVTAQRQSE